MYGWNGHDFQETSNLSLSYESLFSFCDVKQSSLYKNPFEIRNDVEDLDFRAAYRKQIRLITEISA